MSRPEYRGMYKLTDREYKILGCFKDSTEIGFPVDCGYSHKETLSVLQSLTKKSVITGRAPYRLTKLGKRLIENIQ